MMIETTGDALAAQMVVMSLVNTKADALEQKSFTDKEGKTEIKTAPDNSGRVQLRTPLKAIQIEDGQASREVRDVSISILTPSDLPMGQVLSLAGKVWVTHYVTNNNRLGISIVAEGVKALQAPKPANQG